MPQARLQRLDSVREFRLVVIQSAASEFWASNFAAAPPQRGAVAAVVVAAVVIVVAAVSGCKGTSESGGKGGVNSSGNRVLTQVNTCRNSALTNPGSMVRLMGKY